MSMSLDSMSDLLDLWKVLLNFWQLFFLKNLMIFGNRYLLLLILAGAVVTCLFNLSGIIHILRGLQQI